MESAKNTLGRRMWPEGSIGPNIAVVDTSEALAVWCVVEMDTGMYMGPRGSTVGKAAGGIWRGMEAKAEASCHTGWRWGCVGARRRDWLPGVQR